MSGRTRGGSNAPVTSQVTLRRGEHTNIPLHKISAESWEQIDRRDRHLITTCELARKRTPAICFRRLLNLADFALMTILPFDRKIIYVLCEHMVSSTHPSPVSTFPPSHSLTSTMPVPTSRESSGHPASTSPTLRNEPVDVQVPRKSELQPSPESDDQTIEDEEESTTHVHGDAADPDVLIVDWDGPDDPENPKKCVLSHVSSQVAL